jgi:hypothetical protein
MLRNYRTMHLLNQRRTRQALAELDRAVPRYTPPGSSAISELVIDKAIAAQLNADSSSPASSAAPALAVARGERR